MLTQRNVHPVKNRTSTQLIPCAKRQAKVCALTEKKSWFSKKKKFKGDDGDDDTTTMTFPLQSSEWCASE
jgi:hypothetical protein